MRKSHLLKSNKGYVGMEVVMFFPVVAVFAMLLFMFLGDNTPGKLIKSYNTTGIINKVYEDFDGESTDYNVQVTAEGLSAKFDSQNLYNKYKGKEGTEIPTEITEYQTKEGVMVKKITKVL